MNTQALIRVFSLALITGIILISCKSGGTGGEPTLYDVTVSVAPGGAGTIAPSADSTYEEGTTVNLMAAANEEYLFAGWSGSLENADNPLSFTADKPYGLTAHFERKTYELVVTTEGAGTVSEEIVEPSAKEYEHSTTVELIATPSEGYRFVEWSGDLSGSDNPAQITVDAPKEVTAVFEKKSYDLIVVTIGEGAVAETVISQKATSYEYGTMVELAANPAEGWEFTGWQEDLTGTENPARVTVAQRTVVAAKFESLFYLEGSTVKCPEAEIGESGTVGGISYTKRSASQITPENTATTCTSETTDMSNLFKGATNFNGDISHWDVSSVTNMNSMFYGSAFNQDLSGWNVGNVTNMGHMFAFADAFNQDLSNWDVSSVTSMSFMFSSADTFNGDISSWDVSSVTNMNRMFQVAISFNGDLSNWDVSSVTNMGGMFVGTNSFNADIGNWDVSNVTNMASMFRSASSFNQDLSGWCVNNIDSEPSNFATGAGFEGNAAYMPQWGDPCSGS